MSEADTPLYSLPRDTDESTRLDTQHECVTRSLGYLLHPTIARSIPKDAVIADVGCGTGAWMIELSRSLPSVQFEGLDISDAQFPASHPQNCTLRTLDILQAVPQELESRYDVVQMRLLVCALSGKDWVTATTNAMKLLKPGGWLQWCECDFEHLNILQAHPGESRAALVELFAFILRMNQSFGKWKGESRELLQNVQRAGFEQCTEDVVSSDRVPEIRFKYSGIGHLATVSMAKRLVLADSKGSGRSAEEIDDLCKKADLEIADGKAYYRWNVHNVIGRKPQA